MTEALCWSHARRKFFVLADITANARRGKTAPPISPIAFEAVKRIDLLFDIERNINGLAAEQRLAGRSEKRWAGFTHFLEDGRICLTNNAAERALRGLALGRKSWLFAGSQRGADRAAVMYTLIAMALCRARYSAQLAAAAGPDQRGALVGEGDDTATLEFARTGTHVAVLPPLGITAVRNDPNFRVLSLRPLLVRRCFCAFAKGTGTHPAVMRAIEALQRTSRIFT